ncbi:MAG: neutral/alkaline non-lysosomal ceramidase N-terminal domain-containing protein [Candidatus Hydrogenedentota bacterium]
MTEIIQNRYYLPAEALWPLGEYGGIAIKLRHYISLCLVALSFLAHPGVASALQAGAAKVAIILPEDVPLAGHLYRRGRNAHIARGTINARSLYLESDQIQVVLVSLDLYAITPELRARILESLPIPIAKSNVILTATHTHSGPGGLAKSWFHRQLYGRYMSEVVEAVAVAVEESIIAAESSKRRATIGYEIGEQKTLTKNMFEKKGPHDPDLGVIRVDDSDGNTIAILGTFSGRPATILRDNGLVLSADFPGVFCDELEGLSASGTVAFFLSGAAGDQVCTNSDDKQGWEWTEHVGKELAGAVKSIANRIKCDELAISIGYVDHPLPGDVSESYLPRATPFQSLAISHLLITFLPGEPYATLKRKLSSEVRKAGFRTHILVGLSNDNLMGLATADSGDIKAYGSRQSINIIGDTVVEWCLKAISDLMKSHNDSDNAVDSTDE